MLAVIQYKEHTPLLERFLQSFHDGMSHLFPDSDSISNPMRYKSRIAHRIEVTPPHAIRKAGKNIAHGLECKASLPRAACSCERQKSCRLKLMFELRDFLLPSNE